MRLAVMAQGNVRLIVNINHLCGAEKDRAKPEVCLWEE